MSSEKVKAMRDLIGGSVGGVAIVLVGHPFDTLKVRIQTGGDRFKGVMDCVRQTVAKEGAMGFYKGITSPLMGVTAVNSLLFWTYGTASRALRPAGGDGKLPIGRVAVAGGITGFVIAFVEGPVELIKAKLQVQYGGSGPRYTGTIDCARQLLSQYGVRGIFQGLAPTFLRNIPANAGYFAFYELIKRRVLGEDAKPSATAAMLGGAAAGMAYWTSSFPADVIKSNMQVDASDPTKRRFRSTLECARHIWREKGFGGFWLGFGPAAVRAVFANAACFVALEATFGLLDKAGLV